MKKPTISDMEAMLRRLNPLGLAGAAVTVVGEHNHLVYRAEKGGLAYALRTINPESHRKDEWISMADEFRLLNELMPTGLAPIPYHLIETRDADILIQEFVDDAVCYNDLKPLSDAHLRGAAIAIAKLNRLQVDAEALPFLKEEPGEALARRIAIWQGRLADAVRRTPSRHVAKQAARISATAADAWYKLVRHRRAFDGWQPMLHFDAAHAGNTYWRRGQAMFLDWQKVSLRRDPSFTLVRFATTVGTEPGVVPERMFETLVDEYARRFPSSNFYVAARARLMERLTSDLVWVLWEHSRQPVKEKPWESVEASLDTRTLHLKNLIRSF